MMAPVTGDDDLRSPKASLPVMCDAFSLAHRPVRSVGGGPRGLRRSGESGLADLEASLQRSVRPVKVRLWGGQQECEGGRGDGVLLGCS